MWMYVCLVLGLGMQRPNSSGMAGSRDTHHLNNSFSSTIVDFISLHLPSFSDAAHNSLYGAQDIAGFTASQFSNL